METKPDLSHVKFDLKALSNRFISQVPAFICSRVVSLDLVGSRRHNQLTIPQYTEPQELADVKKRFEAMSNLLSLKIDSFLIPKEIIYIQHAPLTSMTLDRVQFCQDSFEALTSAIETCRSLVYVSINCIEPQNQPLPDKSPLFAAIRTNSSIRKFNFIARGRVLNQNEMTSVSNLIRETRTLRNFSLIADHFEGKQFNDLFDALAKNVSLLSFRAVSNVSPEEDMTLEDPIELDSQPILAFLAANQALQFLDTTQGFDIHGKLEDKDVEEITQAVTTKRGLLKFHVGSLKLEKLAHEGDIVHYSLRNEALHLLKLGRTLTFERNIRGKQLAVEVIEYILKQVTVDSIWPDTLWSPIRRAVMNRGTLGKLCSDTRHFDAFELAYLCRSIGQ